MTFTLFYWNFFCLYFICRHLTKFSCCNFNTPQKVIIDNPEHSTENQTNQLITHLVNSSNKDSACKLKCISLLSNQCKTKAGRGVQYKILGTKGMSVSAFTEAAKWKWSPGVTPALKKNNDFKPDIASLCFFHLSHDNHTNENHAHYTSKAELELEVTAPQDPEHDAWHGDECESKSYKNVFNTKFFHF